MSLLADVLDWFADPASWQGPRGALHRLVEHLQISGVAVLAACLVALPPAVWLGHKRRFGNLAINVSNMGRAIPSVAILVLGQQVFGLRDYPVIGLLAVFLALFVLAVPPVFTNAYVAVAEIPDDVRDSAFGMGMSDGEVMWRVEMPLAVPLLMAGVRTAAVQVVATATIAAFMGAGGLGRFIVDGYAVRAFEVVSAGALLVAVLSVLTEAGLALVQFAATPRGLREADVPDGADDPALTGSADVPEGRGETL